MLSSVERRESIDALLLPGSALRNVPLVSFPSRAVVQPSSPIVFDWTNVVPVSTMRLSVVVDQKEKDAVVEKYEHSKSIFVVTPKWTTDLLLVRYMRSARESVTC